MKPKAQESPTWFARILVKFGRSMPFLGARHVQPHSESRAGNEAPAAIGAYGMLSDMSHYNRSDR